MKANELRVGNYVEYNLSSGAFDDETKVKPLKVIGIDVSDWMHNFVLLGDGCNNRYDFDEFKGIHLTEEWLVKFKFGNYRETNVSGLVEYTWLPSEKLANFDIILTVINGEYRIFKDLKLIACRKIQSVHQFQNWFFVNTGHELSLPILP